MSANLVPTPVYDSYWRFAAERLAIYYRRQIDSVGPWTIDPILREYRFTNSFRAADRVSQYLIREVQYRKDRSQAPAEIFFRTLLFKLFNRIETWEAIEDELGPVSWQSADLSAISALLDRRIEKGERNYSAAYIMPSPDMGHARKHSNHLAALRQMMNDGMPSRVERAKSLQAVYEILLTCHGFGSFLAFQFAIDLNYSTLIDFEEDDFVVAGPGALDGISKCFANGAGFGPARIIEEMVERQDAEFKRLGLEFAGLYGRRLRLIDCQNLFCEISKYARVAHPDIPGLSGRARIKQRYKQAVTRRHATPYFPPKWKLAPVKITPPPVQNSESQLALI